MREEEHNMSIIDAKYLYESGRAHALAADRLYRAAADDGLVKRPDDPEQWAFNGPYSLSIHYLICLGLELLLKSTYVAYDGPTDKKQLLNIGHDLELALDEAEKQGFNSEAPRLREIAQILREPYMAHYFRYDRPEEIPLPDFVQMVEALQTLDGELEKIYNTAA